MNISRRNVLLGATAAAALGPIAARAQTSEVVIGVIYPFSGGSAQQGVDAQKAYETALEVINKDTDFDLPLASEGSEFQKKVWAELRRIPYGETASYGDIARRLGYEPVISRAVGAANGANPIPIIVPCHRVIGSDGSLTGYAGGLERKKTLLDLEVPGLF